MCFSYNAPKCTGALTVQEALDCDNVMNLATTGILNAFQTMQDDINSVQDTPPPLMNPTPESSTMNSATSTVSDLMLQTMQQQMQLIQQMINKMSTMQCQPIDTTQQSSNCRWHNTNQRKSNQQKYCWRHGACNHAS